MVPRDSSNFWKRRKKPTNPEDCIKLVSTKWWWAWESERLQKGDGILTAWGRQFFWAGGHRLSTHLTETVPSIKGNSIAWWKWTPGEPKRKKYFSKSYARNFPLFPSPWVCCLLPVQLMFYRHSGQIVFAMWPWQSLALEEIHSVNAEQRLDLPCVLDFKSYHQTYFI